MCGIAGIIGSRSGNLSERVRVMAVALAHRGPDDAGEQVWLDHGIALAHRRLAIIGLTPAGRNPMANEDGSVWIIFNGEIYNHRDLRAELVRRGHVFRSTTDTEVILHAYEEWGDEHVSRLRGMFAYALYDRRPQHGGAHGWRALLVRDRLGIKPLVYATTPDGLCFGSEAKALLTQPQVDRTVDATAVFDFLTYGYVPAPKTAYRGICKLRPGYHLVVTPGGMREECYWQLQPASRVPRTFGEAVEETRALVADSVSAHLVSDVPVGLFLSGGVDSSTIAAEAARQVSEPLRTYAIGFDVGAHSEHTFAAEVAQHLGTRHSERIIQVGTLQDAAARMLALYDEPFADTSAIPTEAVSALASHDVKVVLSGDGGDEVFGGYAWHARWLARDPFEPMARPMRPLLAGLDALWPRALRGKHLIGDLARPPLERYARMVELFTPAEKRALLDPGWHDAFSEYDDYWFFRQHWQADLDPLTRLQYLDLKTFLPDDILVKVDRASMAHSLEVRPPLLDHLLVERVLAWPSAMKMQAGELKALLKCAVRDRVPASVIERPKKGFSAPMTEWRAELCGPSASILQQADPLQLLRRVVPSEVSFRRGAKTWGLLLLKRWLLSFADQPHHACVG